MKKKIVSLLLAMTMIVGVCLSGCGNETQEESKTPVSSSKASEASSEVASSEEKAELEEKTIQVWIGGPGKQKDSDQVWEKFNEMLQEYVPNTTVEFTVMTTSEYGAQFEQMLAASEGVDLTWVANWVTGGTSANIDDGNLTPLNDLLAEYGQGIVEAMGQNVIDAHIYKDGELYYLPSWQGLTSGKLGIYVPKEIAALCGGDDWYEETQEIITEWWNHDPSAENLQKVFDQFDKYFAAAKDAGKLYAGMTGSKFFGWNYAQNYQVGSELVGPLRLDNTFTVVDTIQDEHYKTFCKNIADYYQKGYIRSDIASVDTSQFSFVKDGEYNDNTCIIYQHNYLTASQAESQAKSSGTELYTFAIEEKGYLGKGDATAMAIPYCADEPERAMMVLDAIYSVPELYQLLIYGIEGQHYTDNGDGTITTSYGAQGTADSDYGLWKWTIGTCKNSLVTQDDTAGYYDELAANDAQSPVNIWGNFSFDGTGTEDICAALKALRLEYDPILSKGYMGADWEASYDKYVAARKAAGVDKLIEEMQKQITAYVQEQGLTSW